ncbi:hypothetical protein C8R43DRAFT_1037477 [Mycena crocata]|nr:hypothetical protein C8R43DRAFT_1037477 [Mycena crocata]
MVQRWLRVDLGNPTSRFRRFSQVKHTHNLALTANVSSLLDGPGLHLSNEAKEDVIRATGHLFGDNECWPDGQCQYYLGQVPPVLPLLQLGRRPSLTQSRLATRIAHTWHSEGIRLAGRIWGQLQRKSNPEWEERRQKDIRVAKDLERTLPLHLRSNPI